IVGDSAAESRHAARPAFSNRLEDVRRLAAVDPLVVGKRRTDAATAVRVAARTVHLVEELFALRNGVRVVLVRISHFHLNHCRAGLQLALNYCARRRRSRGTFTKPPLFALAGEKHGSEEY